MEENRLWRAKWIWAETAERGGVSSPPADGPELAYARRVFEAPEQDCSLTVSVSGDSRYRLFINGVLACSGPCKGDAGTHYYETVELSDYLEAGKNVLAAVVLHYPLAGRGSAVWGPASVARSHQGAFLLEGELLGPGGESLETLDSNESWRMFPAPEGAFDLEPESFTLFIGGGEKADGRLLPHGWQSQSFPDESWRQAVIVAEPYDAMYGQLGSWLLAPRSIPLLEEKQLDFLSLVRGSVQLERTSKNAWEELDIPAEQRIWLELDAGLLTTGVPVIEISGGRDAEISILYSECYELPPGPGGKRRKGVRDDYAGKELYGFTDIYTACGCGERDGQRERYEPLHRRAFRYLRIEVAAARDPVVIHSLHYRRIGYPLAEQAWFECSDPSLTPLWDNSIRTLRACMQETFEDTPYYEQMQYEMDSRLQALFSYYVGGDDRLGRKAIHDFHSSLLPSGMLQSRYPSESRQIIPGFSLFWIMMVHDHYRWHGDGELVRRYRPSIDAILDWFGRRVEAATGLVGIMPVGYWPFVDWTEAWRDHAGAPPAGKEGPLTVYNLMYAAALDQAAELSGWTGRPEMAGEYRSRAEGIRHAVQVHCRSSEEDRLFRDGPSWDGGFSQHAQIWAVLSGAVHGAEARELMTAVLQRRDLAQASYAMSFFLFRALSQAGLYDEAFPLWDAWRRQVDDHLTTWVEDPVSERSDCHAWGAVPLYEFPAEVLGVQPLLPGYEELLIAPNPGPLTWARGAAATIRGLVCVEWSIGDGRMALRVDGPRQVPAVVRLPGGKVISFESAAGIEVDVELEMEMDLET